MYFFSLNYTFTNIFYFLIQIVCMTKKRDGNQNIETTTEKEDMKKYMALKE